MDATSETDRLYRRALILAMATVLYNLVEGCISVAVGIEDESLSLFGFGVDSFVEVISGIGIWHMVRRIRRHRNGSPDRFEATALRITGTAFFFLALGLAITAALNLYRGHAPEATFWGVVIAFVSIVSMAVLIHLKQRVGERLHSRAVIADAHCTRACLQLSVVLLIAAAGYELTGIGGIDAAGALVIAALAFREGREAYAKASGLACSCEIRAP